MARLLACARSFAALVLAASAASAQAASALPTPLVAALLAGRRYDTAMPDSFYVDRLPPGWPVSLSPRGVPVVGGTARRGALVAVFADTAPRALARFHALLDAEGWTQPVAPPRPGFSSSPFPATFFCHDSARVSALLVSDSRGGSNLYVSLHPSTSGECGVTLAHSRRSAPEPSLDLPVLPAPPGSTLTMGGTSTSNDDLVTRAYLTGTALAPAQLVAFYGERLGAAGWAADPALSSANFATQRFTARDRQAKPWLGFLTVMTNGARRDLSLVMHTASDQ